MKTNTKKIIISILANVAICLNMSAISDALKVKIFNGSISDETVVRFLPTATPGFDGSSDAYKIFNTSPTVPSAYTKIDAATALSINALPSLSGAVNIPLFTHIKVGAYYTFQSVELGTGFPSGTLIFIEDTETGMSYSFRNGESFTMGLPPNTVTSQARFIIHVIPQLPTTISTTNITCHGLNDGKITVTKPGNSNWNYTLKDSNAVTVASDTAINETIIIDNLAAGTYTLLTLSATSQPDSSTLTIAEPLPVMAAFTTNADTVLLSQATLNFTNTSNNGAFYSWSFGDGSSTASSFNANHIYSSEGTYTVELMVADSAGCTAQISKDVIVEADPQISTGMLSVSMENNVIIRQNEAGMQVSVNAHNPSQMFIMVSNNMGQILSQHKEQQSFSFSENITLQTSGTYIVRTVIDGKAQSKVVSFIK